MVQPGQRNKRFVPATGRMSESRWAWVRTVIGQVVIMVDEPGESEELLERKETGRSIRLIIPLPGRKPVTWNLTALTEAELLKLKELVDAAFAWALPVVRQ